MPLLTTALSPKFSSKLPFIAAIAAFMLAAIGFLSALQELSLALFALVPLAAGIGILFKRAWNAYGFALFQATQLFAAPLILWHAGGIPKAQLWARFALNVVLIPLFLLAGRVMQRQGAKSGSAAAWIAVCVLSVLPFLFVRAFVMPSGSMEDTLLIGDRILVRVFPRGTPGRGNIVVFHYPADRRQILAKRVIGVPGDRIRIAEKNVYRNGVVLAEPYAVHKFHVVDKYRDNFPGDPATVPFPPGSPAMLALQDMLHKHVVNGEAVVPPGSYFVLGDNRDSSLDSRYWGFLDASDILGKPFLIYDSKEPPPTEGTIPAGATFSEQPRRRWGRIFRWL